MSEKITCRGFFLTEQTAVDGDVIKNVVVLGPESNNGNSYSADAMRSAVPLYEGKPVYLDHDLRSKARRADERFGHIEGARFVESDHDGKPRVRGDLHFLRNHPMTPRVLECLTKGLSYMGLSHVADGVGRKEGTRRFVEQITRVATIDLVDRAATGSLVEQDDGADPAAAHTEALTQMVVAIMSDPSMDKAAKKKKLEALLDMQDDTGAPPPPGDAGALPPPMNEATMRKVMGELIEQTFDRKVKEVVPVLVEQEVQRRAAEAKYVKPQTQPPHAQPPAQGGGNGKVPTDPAERKKWLRQP